MERTEGQKHPQFDRFKEKPCISEEFPIKADEIFNLLKVDPKEDINLRILDQNEDDSLILVHYLVPTLETRHIRGIIIDIERMKIVVESFPFTEEYVASSTEALTVPWQPHEGFCRVTKAYEGTILRVFRGRNTKKWYLSTHRKIDGRRSRWAGPEFGALFNELWGEEPFDTYLHPELCYVFLLSHKENRLVCEISTPTLYHVETFSPKAQGLVANNRSLEKEHPNVKPQICLTISSTKELVQQTKELDWKECSGLLVTQYSPNGDITGCWKLVPDEYQSRRSIRGNEPNLRLRYLQLKTGGIEQKIRDLFPEKKDLFDQVEKDLNEFPLFLKRYYKERYVNRNFVYLPKEVHCLLEIVKTRYQSNKSLEENISSQMKFNDGRQLNAMIRFMNQEKKEDA